MEALIPVGRYAPVNAHLAPTNANAKRLGDMEKNAVVAVRPSSGAKIGLTPDPSPNMR